MELLELNRTGNYEADAPFSQLLDRVEAGEEITISRRGQAVARLVPILEPVTSTEVRREAILKMRELASRNRLDGLRIRDLIDEGRR